MPNLKFTIAIIKRHGGLGKTLKKIIRHENLSQIILKKFFRFGQKKYSDWILKYEVYNKEALKDFKKQLSSFNIQPLISIIFKINDTNPKYLIQTIESVRGQLYPNWKLCIFCNVSSEDFYLILNQYSNKDSRIKVTYMQKNLGRPIELVYGEWITLIGKDDLLSKHSLFYIVEAINKNENVPLIFSDEDQINEVGKRFNPFFKSEWDLNLFYSQNLSLGLVVLRTVILQKIVDFNKLGMSEELDFDFMLKYIELIDEKQIYHIPRVLYHKRASKCQSMESMYGNAAQSESLNAHFKRIGINANVELVKYNYKITYGLPLILPLVSLIIPTRNGLKLIRTCVQSILDKTSYANYEILIIDNSSDDPETMKYFASISLNERIRVVRDERPFNYSAINNSAVEIANGEIVGLLNNDLEVVSPEWLSEMVSYAVQHKVGAVGAKLLYPDNTIQHAGVILGIGGVAGHAHKHIPRNDPGYHGRASSVQSLSAVTAACLVIRKEIFKEVNGLNEQDLKIAFNDIDFCLRVREAGYQNIWTPYAELYHHESASRGLEDSPEKIERFKKEIQYMKQRWGDQLLNDPAYNPNLTLDYEDFGLAWPPRI